VDAATGKVCDGFSQIDLTKDVGLKNKGEYQVTSPPAIVGNLVITGSSIGDGAARTLSEASSAPFTPERENWCGASILCPRRSRMPAPRTRGRRWPPIRTRHSVRPHRQRQPDFYGGERPGNNGYANSVVAIRASTGEVLWAFQVVHHDLWITMSPRNPRW